MAALASNLRVAIVGASSLRGKELKQVLEERSFAADDIRLIDDEAVGTLTDAGGEAAFIHALDEDSFAGVRFAFLAGEPGVAARAWPLAHQAGCTVIDMSGALADVPAAAPWIPSLDAVLPPPGGASGRVFASPGVGAILACTVAAALGAFNSMRLALTFFQPVSERGQPGIDELESQTVSLLSFQPVSQEVYGAQVAFNLLPRYGEASGQLLGAVRRRLAREVERYLAGRVPLPALQLIQAPVFYSLVFSGYAEFTVAPPAADLQKALERAGFRFSDSSEPPLSNLSVADQDQIGLEPPEPDPLQPRGYWLWGGADNVRMAAANAAAIAEKLLGN
jgi:aspartate-semialdehyde dehydrogenase